jgi:hypothetical protein
MADRIADAEVAGLFAIEQDGEKVRMENLADDISEVGQELIEVKGLGRDG